MYQRKKIKMNKLWIPITVLLLLLAACEPALPETPTLPPAQDEEPQLADPSEMEPTEPAEEPTTESPIAFEPFAALHPVASGLTAPVALDAPDDGSGRRFIVDQVGLIRIVDGEDQLLDTPFLDLRDRIITLNGNYDERGLLGLAFHPAYAENGRFFVYYSAPLRENGPPGWNHTSILSEYTVSGSDANTADPNSERIIMAIDQPQGNHNAGSIVFGPDGYLYVPLGDGGGANDTGLGHVEDWYPVNEGGNSQNLEDSILGNVLRIDINSGEPYAVPADNPGISVNYPEIWAYGFRNPYRMAFDPGGENDLFLGDAGQELWEEVSIVVPGGNYGWNVREGTHCFSTANPGSPNAITNCPTEDPEGNPLIDPIIEFPNTKHPAGGLGSSIVGGVVYRGATLPAWDGKYIFGQWSVNFQPPQGSLFAATRPASGENGLWRFEQVRIAERDGGELGEFLLALGQDSAGEVYVLTSSSSGPSGNTGIVYKLMPVETE